MFKLQYNPHLICEECSLSELYILRENRERSDKLSFTEKGKTSERDESTGIKLQIRARETTGFKHKTLLISCAYRVASPSYPFCGKIATSGNGPPRKNFKLADGKVHVLSFSLIPISSARSAPCPSYTFCGKTCEIR